MTRRVTDNLSQLEKIEWQRKAERVGLIRRTGIVSDKVVGSMGQLAKYIARPDVVIVKRHKVSEELPPDDVEVLAYGHFDGPVHDKEHKLVKYSTSNGWYVDCWENGVDRLEVPEYWVSLDFLLEGAKQ